MQKLIFLGISILLFFACNSNNNTGNIKLDNGEKWSVNDEMKPHIEQGSKILNDYLTQKGNNYQKLAGDLKNQNDQLVKSCTMKGESHDELHKWLLPHIALVQKLEESKDPQQAATVVEQLEQSFKTYQNHFK